MFFFLIRRPPPGSTRTDTLFPDTPLFRSAFVETDFSLPHLFDGSTSFRPNVLADRADQFGASVTFHGNQPLSRTLQLGGDLTVEAATGEDRKSTRLNSSH